MEGQPCCQNCLSRDDQHSEFKQSRVLKLQRSIYCQESVNPTVERFSLHRLSITFDYLDSKLALKLVSESLESASRRADY